MAVVVPPLRAGQLGLIAALLSMAVWFAQGLVILLLWGGRSFLSISRSVGLNAVVRKRLRSPDLFAKVTGIIVVPFILGFVVLDIQSGKPAPYGVSAWGGYAIALLLAAFSILMAPVVTAPVDSGRRG